MLLGRESEKPSLSRENVLFRHYAEPHVKTADIGDRRQAEVHSIRRRPQLSPPPGTRSISKENTTQAALEYFPLISSRRNGGGEHLKFQFSESLAAHLPYIAFPTSNTPGAFFHCLRPVPSCIRVIDYDTEADSLGNDKNKNILTRPRRRRSAPSSCKSFDPGIRNPCI